MLPQESLCEWKQEGRDQRRRYDDESRVRKGSEIASGFAHGGKGCEPRHVVSLQNGKGMDLGCPLEPPEGTQPC